ncbi:MAG: triose-phosphate isomerase [Pseudomonadota bacterium]
MAVESPADPVRTDASDHDRPYIAGNWKMNGTRRELAEYLALFGASQHDPSSVDVALYVPATLIDALAAADTAVRPGAQNLHEAESGAFTGELSAGQLLDAGAASVLVGHSERRALFAESDSRVAAKVRAAQQAGLAPVVCVGETLAERERGEAEARVLAQLEACRASFSGAGTAEVPIVAYEPVWAIGTGKTASPVEAQAMHRVIREWLCGVSPAAAATRLLYGGSVNETNAAELLAQPDINGALVGGASLKADAFAAIVRAALG